jgi:tetratricopeptide (TPR) repeat protein
MFGVIRSHLWSRRAQVWAALLLALAVVLCFQPLLDSLGFEFALVFALPVSLAAADLGARLVRRRLVDGVFPATAAALVVAWALLLPPLVAISLNALRVRQCDWGFGLLCWAALPGFSAVFGTVAGVVAQSLLPTRPRTGAVLAWLIVVASVAVGVWRFYAGPAIFGYDPFVGYFPGALYDEQLVLPPAFWWSRLYQLCVAAAALAGAHALLTRSRGFAGVAGLAAAAALLLFLRSGALGFAVDAEDIARALGGRRETAHFVIHYPKGHKVIEPQLDAIALEHEFRLAQVVERLGAAPSAKIHSFYFASAAQKWRWMGARHTYIAKPWRHEIYIQHDEFPHSTLRHEIAHVIAGEFGDPFFRVSVSWWGWPPASFNVGMIEGIAVAADWPGGAGRLTPHQAVRAMKELALLPPVRRLLQPSFFSFSPAQGYTTAGSFVHFLLAREGTAKLQEVYRRGGRPDDFAAVYGQPLRELEAAWHAEVADAPLEPADLEIARERYRRRAIFARPCPHAVAERLVEAGQALARGDAERAVTALRRVCRDDPGEPSHRMVLAAALERAEQPDAALAVLADLHDDSGERYSQPLRARALWNAADLRARGGDFAAALALVERALALSVDEDARRNLLVRRLAFAGGAGTTALRAYLVPQARELEVAPGDDDEEAEPDDTALGRATAVARELPGLGDYLVGRQLLTRRRFAEAAAAFTRAARAGIAEPLVARENTRLRARAAYLAGDLATARVAAIGLLALDQPLRVQLEGVDFLERLAFVETATSR